MFDFLKGGKANIKLALDRSNQVYVLGETIHATVTITGEKDIKVQQGRLEFVFHEEYQYRHRETERDSDGDSRTTTETTWKTDEPVLKKEVFFNETTIRAGSAQTFQVDLPIPLNAAPTGAGKIVRIQWLVKAILDRRMASDISDKAEVYVFAPAPGRFVQAGSFGNSTEPGEAEMSLTLPGTEWVVGETIAGELQVCANKEFDVNEIRVELSRREFVPRDLGHEHVETIPVRVSGSTHLSVGQKLTFPFSIVIPTSAPITFNTSNSSVVWQLKGVLARRLRSDTRVEEQMYIYNQRA